MEESKHTLAYSVLSLAGVLFIAFFILKLTHAIDWSWWWVTAPLWGLLALFVLFLVAFIISIETLNIFND